MFIMLLGNAASILINIAIVKLLTNKLSVGDFGLYSLITSLATFPQLVLFAPIASAIFPFIKTKKNENLYIHFQEDIFDLLLLIALLSGAILLIVCSQLMIFTSIPKTYIYLTFIGFIFSTTLSFLTTLDTFSLANSKVNQYTIFPVLNLALKFLTLVVFYWFKYDVVDILLLFTSVHFSLSFIEFYFLKKAGIVNEGVVKVNLNRIFQINSQSKIQILRYGLNFFLWGIFGWAQSFLDKYILSNFMGTEPVGVYAVYWQYGFYPFTIFSSIISQYLTPIFFARIDDVGAIISFLKKLLLLTIVTLVVLCPVFIIASYYLAPFFIKLLTNVHYLTYIKLFPVIVVAGFFYGIGQIITIPLLNSDFVKKMRFPKIASTVLALILFVLLIPRYQLLGILLALLLSNIFYFVYLAFVNVTYLKQLKAK